MFWPDARDDVRACSLRKAGLAFTAWYTRERSCTRTQAAALLLNSPLPDAVGRVDLVYSRCRDLRVRQMCDPGEICASSPAPPQILMCTLLPCRFCAGICAGGAAWNDITLIVVGPWKATAAFISDVNRCIDNFDIFF